VTITRADLAASLPDLGSPVHLPGLEDGAEVWRDADGIPHVLAASARDAFLAQGFVHAQDRLWQMEYDRRRAAGRWAEYAGQAGVAQDLHLRRLGLAATARTDYDALGPEAREMLDAYAAGVNAFLRSTAALPVEFRLLGVRPEPWQPWDSIAVFKVRHVEMGPYQAKLWRARLLRHLGPRLTAALCPGTQPNPTLILPPGGRDGGTPDGAQALFERAAALFAATGGWEGGSNNWALAGRRTASGKPLVAGDPHRALDVPNVYYQNHLACPAFDAIGLSFPGVPGLPHFGHNRDVAWCVTHAMADAQDLFLERFDPQDPGRYAFRGDWRRAEVRRETIQVRGGAPVPVTIALTHHGPIIAGEPERGYALALRYTATAEPNPTFEALRPMLAATSADALEAAMRPWVDPVNNLVFADAAGIRYRTRGRVPVRAPANAWLPVPGWDGEHEWQGAIPFEEMPSVREPETGWLATANSRIAGAGYRHYIGLDFAPDFRTRRVIARLRPLHDATAADMAAIHADRVSIPAQELVALLDGLEPAGPAASDALARLRVWDGTMDPSGAAPAIYAVFRERLVRNLLAPLLGPLGAEAFGTAPGAPVTHLARLKARLAGWIRSDDRTLLPAGATWPAALAQAFADAVAELQADLGPDAAGWRWDRLHVTRPRHPLSAVFPDAAALLDPPSVGVGGDGDTVQASSFVPGAGYAVTGTSVARYVFDLGDWNRSAWIVPLGASGHPGSPHFADQVQDWAAVRLRPMRYDWARIRAEAEQHQRLLAGPPGNAR
jgi:penicillin amidase